MWEGAFMLLALHRSLLLPLVASALAIILAGCAGKPVAAFDGAQPATGLVFEQDLFFEDGKKQHRSWVIRRVDEHRYTATGTGIVGVAQGTVYGNVLHLEFTLDAFPGNALGRLHMSQWMYLQPDGKTLVNRDTLTKAGIIVAQIPEQFQKD